MPFQKQAKPETHLIHIYGNDRIWRYKNAVKRDDLTLDHNGKAYVYNREAVHDAPSFFERAFGIKSKMKQPCLSFYEDCPNALIFAPIEKFRHVMNGSPISDEEKERLPILIGEGSVFKLDSPTSLFNIKYEAVSRNVVAAVEKPDILSWQKYGIIGGLILGAIIAFALILIAANSGAFSAEYWSAK